MSHLLDGKAESTRIEVCLRKTVKVCNGERRIQVNGKRLYDLARRGEAVHPEPRSVEISKIEILDWQPAALDHPEVTLHIDCGPGTYIRSIARDLGEKLGTGATLANLIRTQSCGLHLAQSVTLETLGQQMLNGDVQLTEPTVVLQHLPAIVFDEPTAKRWCQGQVVTSLTPLPPGSWVRVHNGSAHFLGMGLVKDNGIVPKVVFGPTVP